MTVTKYGYLHTHYGPDMDGSNRVFEWVADEPQTRGMTEEQWREYQEHYGEERPGWWAKCEVEPDAGWIGPFETEEEAVETATDESVYWNWHVDVCYGDDPMGDHMGRNE